MLALLPIKNGGFLRSTTPPHQPHKPRFAPRKLASLPDKNGGFIKITKRAGVGCMKLGSGSVTELESEIKEDDKCRERKGIVELLECLEREAIMGDDEGKKPGDYNRRAQIFDKSSKVFQALKENDNDNNEEHQHQHDDNNHNEEHQP